MAEPDQVVAVRHPRGMFTSRVDEKGRLKMPADLQRYLTEIGSTQVFITSFDGRTGRIYPIDLWEEVERLLERAGDDAIDGEDLLFEAQRLGGDAELDNQGRLLMPATLRRTMQVENQPVHLAYFRGHIEVFSEEVFRERAERAEQNRAEKLNKFVNRGLR